MLILPGDHKRRRRLVRNVATGRVLPCSWSDCFRPGDDNIRIMVPHEEPRWRDPATGQQEMLIYIFCSEAHKAHYLKSMPFRLVSR